MTASLLLSAQLPALNWTRQKPFHNSITVNKHEDDQNYDKDHDFDLDDKHDLDDEHDHDNEHEASQTYTCPVIICICVLRICVYMHVFVYLYYLSEAIIVNTAPLEVSQT